MSGKGSAPRPIPDRERFEQEWERIFGNGQGHVSLPLVDGCVASAPLRFMEQDTVERRAADPG